MVKLSRYRTCDYIVNDPINNKRYVFTGAKGNMKCTLSVPDEVYDWLLMSTSAISQGELVVVDDNAKEQFINATGDVEEVLKNIHTREEIETILKSPQKSMEKKLKEITNDDEKKFVLTVAKEMGLDSASKRSFLVKWLGMDDLSTDEVFMNDEE